MSEATELLSALKDRIKEQSTQLYERAEEAEDTNIVLSSSLLSQANTLLLVSTAIGNVLADAIRKEATAVRKETDKIHTSILEEHESDSPGH